MGVDKKLELLYDLSSINEEQADKLIKANEDVIKKAQKQKTKNKKLKQLSDKETEKEEEKSKKRLDNLKDKKGSKIKELKDLEIVEGLSTTEIGAQGGINFFISQFKTSLPVIGPLIAVSGFFVNELLKLDKLAKKFLDIADTRISIFVKRQEQARLENHLDQIIYTTKAGTASPRDSYNSFNSYDRVLKQVAKDRNASSIGGVD